MGTQKPSLHLAENFVIGANLTDFESLDDIKQLAREAHELIGQQPWTASSLEDTQTAPKDIRAGFIGRVAIHELVLMHDGMIRDQSTSIALDGLLFRINMQYFPTGKKIPMDVVAGLAVGNGGQRFEVRAFDLDAKSFGKIHNEHVQQYLAKSAARGIATTQGKAGRSTNKLGSVNSAQ